MQNTRMAMYDVANRDNWHAAVGRSSLSLPLMHLNTMSRQICARIRVAIHNKRCNAASRARDSQ
jgi:hypothetical protein